MNGRPDLGTFEVGGLYRDDFTDELVEFVGVATVSELAGEDVAIFLFVEAPGSCLVATRKSFDQGETFTPAADAAIEDLDSA